MKLLWLALIIVVHVIEDMNVVIKENTVHPWDHYTYWYIRNKQFLDTKPLPIIYFNWLRQNNKVYKHNILDPNSMCYLINV